MVDWSSPSEHGNRQYVLEGGVVYKRTIPDEGAEFNECGQWTIAEFNDPGTVFDQNTDTYHAAIKTALGI